MTSRTDSFRTAFRADEIAARAGIRAVLAWLRGTGLDKDRAGSVEIALAEAVNNIVEHAYAGIDAGEIALAAALTDRGLSVEIVDSGAGLPDNRLPPGMPNDLSGALETLPEGGFGWFLIRQLTSSLDYQRRDGSNRLRLSFDLGESGPRSGAGAN